MHLQWTDVENSECESFKTAISEVPLESILKKPICQAPPHLQKMILTIQKFAFEVKYKPGTQNYKLNSTMCCSTYLTPVMMKRRR